MIAAMPAASPSAAAVLTSGVASVDGLDGGFAGVLASELPVSLPGQPGGIETGDVQGEVSGPAGGPLVEPSLGNPASAELAWYALTGGLPAGVVQGGVQPGSLGSPGKTGLGLAVVSSLDVSTADTVAADAMPADAMAGVPFLLVATPLATSSPASPLIGPGPFSDAVPALDASVPSAASPIGISGAAALPSGPASPQLMPDDAPRLLPQTSQTNLPAPHVSPLPSQPSSFAPPSTMLGALPVSPPAASGDTSTFSASSLPPSAVLLPVMAGDTATDHDGQSQRNAPAFDTVLLAEGTVEGPPAVSTNAPQGISVSALLSSPAGPAGPVPARAVPDAAVELAQQGGGRVTLILTPEGLGRVVLTVGVGTEGVSVRMTGSPDAIAAVGRNGMETALLASGMQVARIELSPTSSGQPAGDQARDPKDSRDRNPESRPGQEPGQPNRDDPSREQFPSGGQPGSQDSSDPDDPYQFWS